MSEFEQEVELLHLLYYRNKNQFKSTHWWKYFSMLHRYCLKYKNSKKKDPKVASFIIYKLTPSAYRAFNEIIAQGQFITLGFTLIGLLSRVHHLLLRDLPEKPANAKLLKTVPDNRPSSLVSVVQSSGDLGEVISRDKNLASGSSNSATPSKRRASPSPPPSPHHKKSKKSKKSKKKSKSAIDEIFGKF